MTSKNVCVKLMREDLKRRSWTIALTVLGFVFTILIPVAVKCGELADIADQDSTGRNYIIHSVIGLLKTGNAAAMVLVAASVLWAVSGFHYLHNSKKVDFYHSLPIKRGQLFLAVYLNGIGVPAVSYLAVLLVSVAVAFQAGVGGSVIGTLPVQGYVLHLLYYGLLYTTAAAAMMLTGNVVIALLGTAVFWGYGPGVIALAMGYLSSWFHTFTVSAGQERTWLLALWHSSPLGNYIGSIGDFGSGLWYVNRMAGVLTLTIFLAVLSYVLYRLRPSEAAGRAMAFPCSRMPIKVLIVIPVSVAFGMFFYLLRGHLTWLVFGTLCGCVLCHCLMEIIYHFDFRKLFSNKIHLAGCMAVSLLLVLAGYFDWYGYDSWVPEPSDVESAAIVLRDKDDWVTYGQIASMPRADGEVRYYWSYKGKADYCYENMNLTDISKAVELAEKGAAEDERIRKNRDSGGGYGTTCIVQFRMKNGKQVQRLYRLPEDEEITRLCNSVHDSPEFKQGAYPIMKQTADETAAVRVQQYGERVNVDLDEKGRARLLAAYQKEWQELTAETREEEFPIGIIQFDTAEAQRIRSEYLEDRERGYTYDYDMAERCYYPIYPSFAETLGILKDAGIIFIKPDENTVSRITMKHYPVYESMDEDGRTVLLYEGELLDCQEEEDIKNLAPALCYRSYYNMGGGYYEMNPDYDTGVDVYFKDSDQAASFYLDLNKLSPEMAASYGFRLTDTGE